MKIWFKKFNVWVSEVAATKWGSLLLFLFAFADASFLPLPVTTIFLIFVLLNTKKVARQVILVVSGTVIGSIGGYFIGHFAWIKPDGELTGLAQFLLHHIPGFSRDVYDKVHNLYAKWDYWIAGIATITPLPYGMFSATAGAFGVNLLVFIFSTLVCQGVKFALIAMFSLKLIPGVRSFAEFNWKPVAIISSVSVVVVIFVLKSL
jgi:membrane protein YqaA with SNARE-associated domain